MKKERVFLFLGIWVAILPYLGFPSFYKDILLTLSGLIVVYYSYTLHKDNKVEKIFDNFSENFKFIKKEEEDNIQSYT